LRLKILKKLRIASLNSEFTGSYKKNVYTLKIKFRNVNNPIQAHSRCASDVNKMLSFNF